MRRLAVPCSCAGNCAVVLVTEWEATDTAPNEAFVEWHHSYTDGFWRRLKAAAKIAAGKDPYLHAIVLTEDELIKVRGFFA